MRTRHHLKLVSIIFLLALSKTIEAQTVVTLYDANWIKVDKQEKAVTRVESETRNLQRYRKLYHVKSGNLISKGLYADTAWDKRLGVHISYDSTGKLEDSSYYDEQSNRIYALHFYPSGKKFVDYKYDPVTKKEDIKAYDESGNIIPNFIYEREADFDGGLEGWKKHLIKHLNPNVPIKKKAKNGRYLVITRFIVNTDGSLSDLVSESNHGHGMEAEAIRVIKLSPNWVPAVQNNKKVKAYRRQPILFVIE